MDILDDLDFLNDEDSASLRDFFADCHKTFLNRVNMTEEEYAKQCAPYLEEVATFVDRIKAEKGRKRELNALLIANAVRQEKSKGGETLHRGYYCPSLIQDIVVGNCKRGSLCKENNPKAIYTHYFDCDNNHIATTKREGKFVSTEYIVYDDNKSVGVMFDGSNQLETIAQCEYDEIGRILEYILVLCDTTKEDVVEYYKELYTYSEKNIMVETSNLLCTISPPILTIDKYVFQMEEGFLKSYTIEVSDGVDINAQPVGKMTYDVKIKRKIAEG